ncbi:MAG: hypothetical protein CW338_06140 [Clostridiales bacterium]|nr:hypothetical protein [Clostridiales bacterium]
MIPKNMKICFSVMIMIVLAAVLCSCGQEEKEPVQLISQGTAVSSVPSDQDEGMEVMLIGQAAPRATWTLRFTDGDGNPVKGVVVNVCDDSACTPYRSDDTGTVSFSGKPFEWDVHILSVPAPYTFDLTQAFKTELNGGEMTFVLDK